MKKTAFCVLAVCLALFSCKKEAGKKTNISFVVKDRDIEDYAQGRSIVPNSYYFRQTLEIEAAP